MSRQNWHKKCEGSIPSAKFCFLKIFLSNIISIFTLIMKYNINFQNESFFNFKEINILFNFWRINYIETCQKKNVFLGNGSPLRESELRKMMLDSV